MKKLFLFIATIGFVFAQTDETINVFIDCPPCDMDYIREEISFINHVRDRKEADVHVLVTGEDTSSGGFEATIYFIGQRDYEGKNDTLIFIGDPTMTEDEIRLGGVRVFKQGLFLYLKKMPIIEKLDIIYSGLSQEPAKEKDPWNNWVFSLRGNLFANGEQSYKSMNGSGGFAVGRTTEDWKFKIGVNGNKNEQAYLYNVLNVDTVNNDTTIFEQTDIYTTNSRWFGAHIIRSLGEHFSFGVWAGIYSSSYENKQWEYYFSPKIEYNFFPYSESTRKQWRFEYAIGGAHSKYMDLTIYEKTHDTILKESFKTTLVFIQRWGSISTNVSFQHFIPNFYQNRTNIFGNMSVRLFRGLNLNLSGSITAVNDQIALKKELSDAERWFRLKEQKTNANYFFSVGFSYTFGSIYNNIVNPRFGSGNGGQQRIVYN